MEKEPRLRQKPAEMKEKTRSAWKIIAPLLLVGGGLFGTVLAGQYVGRKFPETIGNTKFGKEWADLSKSLQSNVTKPVGDWSQRQYDGVKNIFSAKPDLKNTPPQYGGPNSPEQKLKDPGSTRNA